MDESHYICEYIYVGFNAIKVTVLKQYQKEFYEKYGIYLEDDNNDNKITTVYFTPTLELLRRASEPGHEKRYNSIMKLIL